jgi:hypothetical protein
MLPVLALFCSVFLVRFVLFCTCYVLVLFYYLVLLWVYSGPVLFLFWFCYGSVLVLFWFCSSSVLVLFLLYSGSLLALFWFLKLQKKQFGWCPRVSAYNMTLRLKVSPGFDSRLGDSSLSKYDSDEAESPHLTVSPTVGVFTKLAYHST